MTCEQCKFFKKNSLALGADGECWRYPPRACAAIPTNQGLQIVSSRGSVAAKDQACGEFVEKVVLV